MTREEAIAILKPFRDCMVDQHGCPISDAVYALDVALDALSAQQWIPCSERLPDEDYWTGANFQYSADVLMTVYNAEDGETIIDYGHTDNGSWYSETTDGLVPSWWEVLAWMPLPEPYKGET